MNKVRSILKKTFKAVLWVVGVFVLLFLIIAGIIQIPAVQNKLIHAATSFVSNKTHTRVEIKNISISFPKSVVIEGLFLDDLNKDTLVYAGKVKANIALYDLIFNKININFIAFENLNLNLYSTKTDSLFNYNFLITAFANTAKVDTAKAKKTSPWTVTIDNVSLKNIRLRYNDEFSGMNVSASLEKLNLKINKLDLPNSNYNLNDLLVDKLKANVQLTKSGKTATKKSISVLPKITAGNIRINNSTVTFGDAVNNQSVYALIKQFELKDGSVDLQNEVVSSNNIILSESNVQYLTSELASVPQSGAKVPVSQIPNDWKVSIKQINLENNSLSYQVSNKPKVQHAFDASHIQYHQVTLIANDLYYSTNLTKVSVAKFSAIDQNNFAISRFETDFSMDNHSITAKKLKANTANSSINADVNMQYASLQSLKNSLPSLMLTINLKKALIKNSDILYFNPQLGSQPFFQNKTNTTTASGQIHGQINNLKGENIVIQTGTNTRLKTDFSIDGLPNARTAYYIFPNMKLTSGKQDIMMMAGSAVPSNINLPENIALLINFKGKLKSFQAGMGMSSSYGNASVLATIDANENFNGNVDISNFDVGSLLKNDSIYGPVSLSAQVNGHGLNPQTLTAQIKADVLQIYLNKYTYHNLRIDGTASGKEFAGKVNLNDKNAVLDFDGLVNMTPNKEQYKFHLNVQGADLQKLNFSKDDIRIGMDATADFKGGTVDNLNGIAGITNLILTHNGKKYVLDSVMVASVNQPNKSELNFSSALMGLKYNGTLSPASLPGALSQFINKFFLFSDTKPVKQKNDSSKFNFEIQLRNHPILSEVLLPQLKEFEPGIITGSFDSRKNELKLNATMKHILYGTTAINDLMLDVHSDSTALNYSVSSSGISNAQINFANLLFEGKLADNKIRANLSSIDNKNKKLVIQAQITKDKTNYKLTLDPNGFYLMNNRWDIAADNYIEFGSQGFLIHHLFMNSAKSRMNIASVHDTFHDDLNIAIKNFKLEDLSKIVEKDSSLVRGNVDGNVLLKRVNNSYGIIADATITNLFVKNAPIGNLALKADNPTSERFDIDAKLAGADNNLTMNGYFVPKGGPNSLNIKGDVQSLSMKTVQAFSMGQITEASGTVSGSFLVAGSTAAPDITGELTFNNAFMNPTYLNNRYELKHETVQLKSDGIYFTNFTLLDPSQHTAVIDGFVKMKNFSNYIYGLQVNTKDFLLFNTTVKDNKEFYGRMVIDSKINVNGPMAFPVVNAKLKMKKGSNFTFAVPEDKLTTDKGEDVVEFNTKQNMNSILYKTNKKVIDKSSLTGFDLSSVIQIDKEATLRLLMDPTSTDSLVVKGDAALSFTMDRSGKMSLTGAYNLNDGSYLMSLESVLKRKFNIITGSTIIWNGSPLDANITINASYSVRAAPYDLVANQMAGLSTADQNGYKQTYPFLVVLKLTGAILKPEISFEIQLAPEDKGILGGAVNQELNLLNQDPSSLNKQVFALLVLGRFVQDNPLQTETDPTSTLLRSTVGNFLSTQLNQLSSKLVPGVGLNFDIQSYNDYQTGQAQGRTQVEIGLKKQLFNNRLTVQLGGTVDVEGRAATQNSASNVTSDITVDYKMTKDGRFLLKGFRHNLYEDPIDGQLIETGVGVVYVHDFNEWKDLFTKTIKKKTAPNP
ncbi:MAG: translocation/assembly module TamB domain-containing protein [Paludibacter sp.]|nr:translocation/assembly module TamB domain-containing protein [Paludibacter sp.]